MKRRNWDRRPISRDLDQHYTRATSEKAPQIIMIHQRPGLYSRSETQLLLWLTWVLLLRLPGLELQHFRPCKLQLRQMAISSPFHSPGTPVLGHLHWVPSRQVMSSRLQPVRWCIKPITRTWTSRRVSNLWMFQSLQRRRIVAERCPRRLSETLNFPRQVNMP
jgi:hypothetical protein